jgi:acyl carrier protein
MSESAGCDRHVESAVHAEIRRLLDAQGKRIERLSANDLLSEALGLSSQDLIEVVLRLNERLCVDPFRRRAFTELRTVGDLAGAYAPSTPAGDPDAELAAGRRRAEARRDRWREAR